MYFKMFPVAFAILICIFVTKRIYTMKAYFLVSKLLQIYRLNLLEMIVNGTP